MQIVTESGCDLSPEQEFGLDIHYAPMKITLEGESFSGGRDLDYKAFYQRLSNTNAFPTTSQPAPGDFAQIYRELAKTDPDILSIHISSGLSGTCNAARLGAQMVPEANVRIFDTMTLSAPEGWHVQAAARAIQAGWSQEEIIAMLERIRTYTQSMFTLSDLKYLIHGGRISHIKGLMASVLNIKPVIGVGKDDGKYASWGQGITFKRAIAKIADIVTEKIPLGTPIRAQLMHGNNPEGVEYLKEHLGQMYECLFEQVVPVAPILGAHTGPSVVGLAVAPMHVFDIPELNLVPAMALA